MIRMLLRYLKLRGREGSTYAGLGVLAMWLQMQTGMDFTPLLEVIPDALAMLATGNWFGALVPLLLAGAAILKQDRPDEPELPRQNVQAQPQAPRAAPAPPPPGAPGHQPYGGLNNGS